jgi:hypothetical protein
MRAGGAMRFRLVFFCLVALLFSHSAIAACISAPISDVNDRAAFLHSIVEALSHFEAAQTDQVNLSNAHSGQDFLTSVDIANEELQCASDAVDRYKASSNQAVQTAVAGLQTASDILIELNGKVKTSFVADLNGETKDEKAGDRAARMAAMAASYRKAWGLLPTAVSAAFVAIIEFEPEATRHGPRLAITETQRNAINRELRNAFPKIESEKHATLPPAENAAELLFGLLNDKKYPTHDQPFP